VESLEKTFDSIYINNVWGDGKSNPRSGSGSKPENAKPYVDFVKNVLEETGATSVTDFGHGDWRMWGEYRFDGINYTGLEVSKQAHELASSFFSGSDRTFILYNVIASKSIISSELFISKDVFQHLSTSNIQQLLSIVTESHFKYLVICNDIYVNQGFISLVRYYTRIRTRVKRICQLQNPLFLAPLLKNNIEIADGGFRGIDLEVAPLREYLSNFRLLAKVDFDGPKRNGIKKRIYFYKRLDLLTP
jgi:hypothetical protein